MYLKKILMENFKSFGNRMEIPVKKGYTNITGPNGSGKSNIGDAILFVLGPKSSKEIRAGRLTDLIFNGGKDGKPADFCRVGLTFDNEDRTIPMNEDEITFTRKVQCSDNQQGYNSYFYINGRSSSLTEFQNLLSHARISADGYNIVQQGDISRIVKMSDFERRKILDDIAGITKYDSEIEEAEDKKEDVINDLDRINIILDEIQTQVDELEGDRTEALKFQELSDKVKEAKSMKAWKTYRETEKEISNVKNDIDENKDRIEEIKNKREHIREKISKLKEDIQKLDDELDSKTGEKNSDLQDTINELKLEIARAEDENEDAEHTIERNKKTRERLQNEISNSRDELSELKKDIRHVKDDKKGTEEELEEIQQDIKEVKSKQSESDDRINDLRKEGIKVKNKIDKKTDSLADKKVELDRNKDKIDRLVEEISEIEEEKEALEFEKKESEWSLKELKSDNKDVQGELKELKEEFHEKKRQEKRLRKDKGDLEDRVNRLEREYNQLKAQEEAAKNVKRGYSRAVSTILEGRDRGELEGVHGTIAELADVDSKYETALQVSAGGRMQSIVVENDEVASKAIKHLKKNDAGRATFLPLNKMRKGRPRGKAIRAVKDDSAVDFALELVDFDDKYENVFWYVFQDTVVMEDIDSAREMMGGVRMVTLDGEKIERSGAMVGGTLNKNMMSFSAPDRGKLDRVGTELKKTRENLKKVTSELRDVQGRIDEIQDSMDELRSQGDKTGKIDNLEAQVKRTKEKIQRKIEALEEKSKKKSEMEETVSKLERSVEHIEDEIGKLKDERKEISEKIKEVSPQELSTTLTKLQDKEVTLDKKVNKLESTLEMKVDKKERLENNIDSMEGERERLKDEIKEKKSTIRKNEQKIESKENELKGYEKRRSSFSDDIKELRDELDQKKENKIELKHELENLESELEAKKQYIRTQKQKIGALEDTLSELKEDIEDGKDYSDEELPSMKELKNTIRRGENQMEELQPVNMRALKDYKKKKERMDELKEKYTELENRREELDKLIEQLDEKKKIGLMDVKEEINENFKEVYEELSEGGEAHLEIEDPDSPFEGGLIIKVRPPGKTVHRIDALSGGEKGLVSMAFIFAIQHYDPSPFYLLDEIDQNLDGVNAENVAQMIKKNSNFAQFLQVSLRKVTLKKSDHIIGVTIHENGLSDVIMKVNIGDNQDRDIPELSGMSKLKTEV
ncbi:MAG: chromosome segregation protein SMC [Candidatus Saliniplasma sp.]